jgi:hypothetical protein
MKECKYTIPKEIALNDNRCWYGYCIYCNKYINFCEGLNKYICCQCCQDLKKRGK